MAFEVWHSLQAFVKRLRLWKTLDSLKYCPRPWATLWMLIWPFPWKYPLPTPFDPLDILKDRAMVHRRYYVDDNYRILRHTPIFALRDSSLRSLYRLHDTVCADEENYTMLESEYFWRHEGWSIKDIPDPMEPNPLRYALLACIVESMVHAYNYKISLGLRRGVRRISLEADRAAYLEPNKPYEEVPSWVAHVLPVEEWVTFRKDGYLNKTGKGFFEKRHICADASQLHNI